MAEIAKLLNNIGSPPTVSSSEAEARYEVERAAALAKFDAAKRAHDAENAASGLGEAERRMGELDGILWDSEKAVLAGKPSSPAGGSTLLMFAAEFLAQGNSVEPEVLAPALASAARAIAGASNIIISERLAALTALRQVSAIGGIGFS